MKRITALLLAAALVLVLVACGPVAPTKKEYTVVVNYLEPGKTAPLAPPYEFTGKEGTTYSVTNATELEIDGYALVSVIGKTTGTLDADKIITVLYEKIPDDPDPIVDPEPPTPVEVTPPEAPVFEADSYTQTQLYNFITPYLAVNSEFESALTLADREKFYTACYALSHEFTGSEEGDNSYISLDKVKAKVRAYFGNDAGLSDTFAGEDYYPYTVDLAKNVVTVIPMGYNEDSFYFYYAVTTTGEGYRVWVYDLGTEFYNKMLEHTGLEEFTVSWSEIENRASDFNLYAYDVKYFTGDMTLTACKLFPLIPAPVVE